MARRKRDRSPPLSHNAKYAKIKSLVDVPKPTTASSKAMVTRYYRNLYGGKTSKGKWTRGILSDYQVYQGSKQKKIASYGFAVPKRGNPRLKGVVIDKGNIKSVTKKTLVVENADMIKTIYNPDYTPPRGERYRVQIGSRPLGGVFNNPTDAMRFGNRVLESYPKKRNESGAIRVVTTKLKRQSSGAYAARKKKNNRNR